MRSILSFCPSLRILHTRIPMLCKYRTRMVENDYVERPVCPASFAAILEPVREGLVELKM